MHLKLKAKMFFSMLLLSLLSVFLAAGTAMAAPALSVGAVTGDNVISATKNGNNWDVKLAYYPGVQNGAVSFTAGNISGSGFIPEAPQVGGAVATYRVQPSAGAAWAITPASAALTNEAFANESATISGVGSANAVTVTLDATNDLAAAPAVLGYSNPVAFNLTFEEGKLTPVLDPVSLSFTIGKPDTKVVSVKSLKAGGADAGAFTLSDIEVRLNGASVGTWNSLDIKTDLAAKTITFDGSALTSASATFTVRMTSNLGAVEDTQLLVSALEAGSTAGLTVTPSVVRLYLGDAASTQTVTADVSPAAHTITALSVNPASWNGLTVKADPATKKITVSGQPVQAGVTSVDVTAETNLGSTLKSGFTIAVLDQSSLNRIDETNIGIWNYGNKAMKAAELIHYEGFSANTGYNPRGKYDLLFYCDRVMDGNKISVYVKEPNASNFTEVPRFVSAHIPLEAWYYVDKTAPSDPYTSAPPAKGSGTSLGWYRDDINTSAGTMTIAVNSQPYSSGYHTFRIEYAYTDALGQQQFNSQEFRLNSTGSEGGGGGCNAGLGAAALMAAGALVVFMKRGGK